MKGAELVTASGKPMIRTALEGLPAWTRYRDRIGPILGVLFSAGGTWEGRFEAANGCSVIVEGADCLLAIGSDRDCLDIILGDLDVPPDLRDLLGRRSVLFWRDERGHWRVIPR